VPFRRLNEEQMIASAKESSNFMESIRGIQSIKIFGKEVQRKSLWQNFYADSINTGIRTAKFGLIFEVSNGVLFAVENILIIYTSNHFFNNSFLHCIQFVLKLNTCQLNYL
jgi:ATP-binding cassette subfamily B protein RaxB